MSTSITQTAANLVRQELRRRDMSGRDAAIEMGISHTSVIRIYEGHSMNIDVIAKVADWLGVKLSTLLDTMTEHDATVAKVALLIERNPKLNELFCALNNVSVTVAEETLTYLIIRSQIEEASK